MKIRAKLKDVIMLPDNDYEKFYLKQLSKVTEDETSEMFIDLDLTDLIWGDIPTGKMYFLGLRTVGKLKKDDW